MNRKTLYIIGGVLGLIFLGIILFVLARPKVDVQTAGRTTLTMWGVSDSSRDLSEILKTSGVNIRYQQFNENGYEFKLLDALASGKGPDIYTIKNTWLPRYLDKLVPVPIEIFTLRDLENEFVDVVRTEVVAEQRIYALPFYVDNLALVYNKDIFNNNGVASPPSNWDDLALISQRLTRKEGIFGDIRLSGAALGRADNINHFRDIVSLLMMQGGEKMSDAQTKDVSFSRAGGPTAIDFYTSFAKPGNSNQSWSVNMRDSLEAFASGKAAMVLAYSIDLPFIKAQAPQLNFAVAPMPQPKEATVKINYASYWSFVVSNQSKNQEQAWRFIATIARADDSLFRYLLNNQRPPAVRDFIDRFQPDPILGVYSEQNLTARSWYQRDEAAVRRVFENMIESVLEGNLGTRRALSQASQEVRSILRE